MRLFKHDCSTPCWGFDTEIATTGIGGGDSTHTIIGIIPNDGCQFTLSKEFINDGEGFEILDEPVYLVFRGDCELQALREAIQFWSEVLDGFINYKE